MLFFRLSGCTTGAKEIGTLRDKYGLSDRARTINMKTSAYNQKHHHTIFYFVSSISEESVSVGIISRCNVNYERHISPFLRAIGLTLLSTTIDEITFSSMKSLLRSADRNGFIDDDNEILEQFGLDGIGRHSRMFTEDLAAPPVNGYSYDYDDKDQIYEQAEHLLMGKTMIDELFRIYAQTRPVKAHGHPVHYLIQSDDEKSSQDAPKILVHALHANYRLPSRRYVTITIKPGEGFSPIRCDALYNSSIGGTIVVRYLANDDTESDLASADWETLDKLCELIKKYRNVVLTILCLPLECTRQREHIRDKLESISFVELKDNAVSCSKAKEYLKMLAKDRGLRGDKKLFERLVEPNVYISQELNTIFEEWYCRKLKTEIFPQYKEFDAKSSRPAISQRKGVAYDELMEMIGLDSAKKVINQALDMQRAQLLFAAKGMKTERTTMHMVFTGNPGTAKTTVARLFARIMKENGFLSRGSLVEVGRADLVGKYVGWTAPTIKKKFEEAMGGVLFIDEAYSLVDYFEGSYGDEAISTIVQEMENRRKELVVIFAGYPDKMESFLQRNPGLRSRISFHVSFADYNEEELCRIAALIAGKSGLHFSEDAEEKLRRLFERMKSEPDFGNGRYVRSVIEHARMAQASRLLKMDFDSIQRKDVETICGEDIEMPEMKKKEKQQIGFERRDDHA